MSQSIRAGAIHASACAMMRLATAQSDGDGALSELKIGTAEELLGRGVRAAGERFHSPLAPVAQAVHAQIGGIASRPGSVLPSASLISSRSSEEGITGT